MTQKIEKFINNGGAFAKKGFKFQDYVGIYYILHFFKNEVDFEVYFETRDDIITSTKESKNKIQVKSKKMSVYEIIKKRKTETGEKQSIYEKLLNVAGKKFNKFIVACCNFSECDKTLHKVDELIDNYYMVSDEIKIKYPQYQISDKFYIHLIPFGDNWQNAEYFILGYAKDEDHGLKIDLDDHIDNLVKRVGELGEYVVKKEFDIKKKKITSSYMKRIVGLNNKDKIKNKIVEAIENKTNCSFCGKIRAKIKLIEGNPPLELEALNDYEVPDIGDKDYYDYTDSVYIDINERYNLEMNKEMYFAWIILQHLDREY